MSEKQAHTPPPPPVTQVTQASSELNRQIFAVDVTEETLGDWFRVLQLVQSGGGDDELLTHAP